MQYTVDPVQTFGRNSGDEPLTTLHSTRLARELNTKPLISKT